MMRSVIRAFVCLTLSGFPALADEPPTLLPAPAMDEAHGAGAPEKAVLAGGCYWGMQGLFEHVAGVQQVIAGMTGRRDPAESVTIIYDPSQISYGQILQIFFSVAHDPTELNRQGPDEGSRYRSDVFYLNDQQKNIALAYIAQLDKAGVFRAKIVTRLDSYGDFQKVDRSQQDYLIKNPTSDYIVVNDLPKIANLKRMYPALYRDAAVQFSN